ncbi:MAG: permease-like cell division protein FtsX [Clostridiales bacterium]|nr:permease-like cell division protein FtsX [Clostridiales bacterium]
MSFRFFIYIVSEAVRSLIKNRIMTIASVLTLGLCLFIVSMSFMLAANLDYMLFQMGSRMGISVYLRADLSEFSRHALESEILAIPHVTNVEYVSAEDALGRFRDQLSDNTSQNGPTVLDGLENDNPLPASFVLNIESVNYWDFVENELNKLKDQGIENVALGKQAANYLNTLNNVLRVVSLVIILGLGVISMVIIFNTIRLAVNGRKTEINIMKYVGATDAFIRGPFIIEGVLIGVIGAGIPLLISYPMYDPVLSLLVRVLLVRGFEFRSHVYIFSVLITLCLVLGITIGVASSITSIRRHLKV